MFLVVVAETSQIKSIGNVMAVISFTSQMPENDFVEHAYFIFLDEALTCNVCDRSFPCQRQLDSHQQKKRHFG